MKRKTSDMFKAYIAARLRYEWLGYYAPRGEEARKVWSVEFQEAREVLDNCVKELMADEKD